MVAQGMCQKEIPGPQAFCLQRVIQAGGSCFRPRRSQKVALCATLARERCGRVHSTAWRVADSLALRFCPLAPVRAHAAASSQPRSGPIRAAGGDRGYDGIRPSACRTAHVPPRSRRGAESAAAGYSNEAPAPSHRPLESGRRTRGAGRFEACLASRTRPGPRPLPGHRGTFHLAHQRHPAQHPQHVFGPGGGLQGGDRGTALATHALAKPDGRSRAKVAQNCATRTRCCAVQGRAVRHKSCKVSVLSVEVGIRHDMCIQGGPCESCWKAGARLSSSRTSPCSV